MASSYTITFIDTLPLLDKCLQDISPKDKPQRRIAVDLEGIKMSRNGRVAMIQIIAENSPTVWVIDITTLGRDAFDHVTSHGQSLRGVLESANITKLFFDVRNDSDALFSHYEIRLQNVFDIQLLEVAARRSNNKPVAFLSGLAKCIELNFGKPVGWLRIKEEGTRLFAPEKGGSYDIFEQRPIHPTILHYCAQDVTLLFQLKQVLASKLGRYGANWNERVIRASEERVVESMSPAYVPHGNHKAVAHLF